MRLFHFAVLQLLAFVLLVAFLLTGCAAFEKGALVTMVSISQARTDGVLILTKADKLKQADFRERAKNATSKDALDDLENQFHVYNQQFDRALFGFEELGKTISALKNMLKAGMKLDLTAVLKAYQDVSSLLNDMHLQMPKIPGVN
jgi:hypothetical protein